MKQLILLSCCLFLAWGSSAQRLLNKSISVNIKQRPLKTALIIIGGDSDFKFSYNSKILPKDSIVDVYAENMRVLSILRKMFDATYDFKEVGDYIIIRRKLVSTKNVIAKKAVLERYYYITGYVVDEGTGEKISNATIYEKMNLLSAMTDEKGYFYLKLKKKYKTAEISVSKENYIDTTLHVVRNFDQKMTIALTEQTPIYVAEIEEVDSSLGLVMASTNTIESMFNIEKTGLGKILISSKQRIQDLNLKRFYTSRTWQMGIIPPISTHGRMNAQVVNRVSINFIGGYSGGTDLFEFAGIYNMNKGDVKYFQAAGIFNLVGGQAHGFQMAGIMNLVQDSVTGFQGAGIANVVKTHVEGWQFSGIYSQANSIEGAQLAGIANVTEGHVKGAQWATIFNKAGSISGLQIGLINVVTDENTGSSFGLINISKGKNGRKRIGFVYRAPRKK